MESLVVCLQNHDQIGNRPRGERIHQLEQVGLLGQQIAAAFILLSPYTPLIFMGEEWAASTPFEFFSDHQDPEMAAAVGKGRKEEFRGGLWDQEDIPDPQDEACFTRSKLNWAERLEEGHRSMLGWYSQLLNLRAENPRPAEPAGVEADEDGAWLRMDAGNFVVIANLRDSPLTLPFPASGNFSMQLSAGAVRVIETQQLQFEGRGVAIVRKCDE